MLENTLVGMLQATALSGTFENPGSDALSWERNAMESHADLQPLVIPHVQSVQECTDCTTVRAMSSHL
jgi:hypothetical protein